MIPAFTFLLMMTVVLLIFSQVSIGAFVLIVVALALIIL